MQQEARGLIARVFSRPSSKLGWEAAAAMAGSIGLVVLFNVVVADDTGDRPTWQQAVLVAILVCLAASCVMGLVAVFRRRERSWVVLVPTALLCLVITNELIQGLLQLVGVRD